MGIRVLLGVVEYELHGSNVVLETARKYDVLHVVFYVN